MGLQSKKVRIVFRADGNSTIGLGHVFRVLSLIEVCRDKFDCLFIIQQPDEKIASRIREYCPLYDILPDDEEGQLSKILRSSDILVLDGYQFVSNYQKFLKTLVHKLVVIDDTAEIHFYADLIINHGGEFIKENYRKESYTKLLAGFKYLMVRKEFLQAALQKRTVSKVDTAYICMGGADPFNVTIKALKACTACIFIKKIIVITGSAYRNKEALQELIKGIADTVTVQHEENIGADRMVALIGECDIAICPASSVSMEVCCVKAGLLSGMVIDNQTAIHQQLLQSDCCISIGDFNTASTEAIVNGLNRLSDVATVNRIMQSQSVIIDGLSVSRIIEEFTQLALC